MRAGRDRRGEFIGSGPEAFTWKKDVFDAGADHLLEDGVSEERKTERRGRIRWSCPRRKPSIEWRWNTWRKLFRENCSMNEREVQTWLEWHLNGEQKISGLGLCPIRFYLPHGFLVVMSRADKVPAGRVDVSHDFLSQKCCPGQTCELAQIFATAHDGPPPRPKSDSSETGLAAKSRSGIDQATTAAHADSPPSAKNTQRYAAINAEAI